MKILESKSKITKVSNLLVGPNNRFELSEERISKLKGKSIEIMEAETERKKMNENNEQNSENCGTTLGTQTYI